MKFKKDGDGKLVLDDNGDPIAISAGSEPIDLTKVVSIAKHDRVAGERDEHKERAESLQKQITGLQEQVSKDTKEFERELADKDAEFAAKAKGFAIDGAMGVAATALASGVKEGADLERYLRGVADAATIAGTDLGDMGQIFKKVQATGKVTGEVINQMSERGLAVLPSLAKEYGVSTEAMSKMVSQGKVDSETFRRVMEENVGSALHARTRRSPQGTSVRQGRGQEAYSAATLWMCRPQESGRYALGHA